MLADHVLFAVDQKRTRPAGFTRWLGSWMASLCMQWETQSLCSFLCTICGKQMLGRKLSPLIGGSMSAWDTAVLVVWPTWQFSCVHLWWVVACNCGNMPRFLGRPLRVDVKCYPFVLGLPWSSGYQFVNSNMLDCKFPRSHFWSRCTTDRWDHKNGGPTSRWQNLGSTRPAKWSISSYLIRPIIEKQMPWNSKWSISLFLARKRSIQTPDRHCHLQNAQTARNISLHLQLCRCWDDSCYQTLKLWISIFL